MRRNLIVLCLLLGLALPAFGTSEQERQLEAMAQQGSVRAHLELARRGAERGDLNRSLAILTEAIELAPNSEQVLATYARVALAARAPVQAIITLEPLTRMHPTVAEYAYLLGVARLQAGAIPLSVDALREAVRLAPRHVLAHIALGLAYNKQKRLIEARDILQSSLRLAPDSAEAIAALAEAEEGLGELESAERHARRALALDPNQATAHLALGMIHMKNDRFTEARDSLERAVTLDPDTGKIHYQLSLAYSRLGDRDAARLHLERYRAAQKAVEDRLRELYGAQGDLSP